MYASIVMLTENSRDFMILCSNASVDFPVLDPRNEHDSFDNRED